MTDSRSYPETDDAWLIVKRGLYFRPDCKGYTGIKDEAGRYQYDFAKDYDRGECSIMREADGPEFMPAAYSDLVIKHLTKQRDEARQEAERLRAHAQGACDCGATETGKWRDVHSTGCAALRGTAGPSQDGGRQDARGGVGNAEKAPELAPLIYAKGADGASPVMGTAGFSLVDVGRICRDDDPDCRHPLCDCARYVSEQRASSVTSTDRGGK